MNLFLAVLTGLALLVLAGAIFTHAYAWWIGRRYPPTGRFIEVDGCRLHYREEGPASPLGTIVILHGASSNLAESMLGLGLPLARRYRVVAFDRPGHGWSGRLAGMADPARQAAVIAEACRRLDVGNAVVVGHSWAGTILPHFALAHADVAGALVAISGVTHPWPGGYVRWYDWFTASPIGWLSSRTLGVPLTLALRPLFAGKTFSPQPVPPGFVEQAFVPLAYRPGAFQANSRDFAVMYDAVVRQSPRYGEIRLPVVVIGGDSDEIVWTDLHSRSLARDVPGAELIVVPGVGHMPQYARPDLVIPAIEDLAFRIAPAHSARTSS